MSSRAAPVAPSDEGARRVQSEVAPGFLRTSASASLYLFLGYLSYGMLFTPLAELFLSRECLKLGLDAAHCKEKTDGIVNPLYDTAQANAASLASVYMLLGGVPQVFVCALYGCLGDCYGRRVPLLVPLGGGVLVALSLAMIDSNTLVLVGTTTASFCGGIYVYNHAAFAALADVTQDASPQQRSRVFGMVEGSLWVGLLIGPVLGGFATQALGPMRACFVPAGLQVLNLLITSLTFRETLDESRRRPFTWKRANPFSSVWMFATTRTTVLLGCVMLAALSAQNGGVSFLSLYVQKVVVGVTPVALGSFQSTVLGASVAGLLIFMPLLVQCLSLSLVTAVSCLNAVLCYCLFAMATEEWQFFAISAGLVLTACFFPIVRTGMSNTFGRDRYGESLAAVGVLEQFCSMIGSPIVNSVYVASEKVEFQVGSLTVRSVACLCVAGMYLLAAIAGLLLPELPKDSSQETSLLDGDSRADCVPASHDESPGCGGLI